MLDLSQLEAEAARNTDVDASAVLVIAALLAEVEASKTDPAAVQAIVDRFRASTDSLAAAIATTTPPPAPSARNRP